jgi:hypothetical protein
MPATKIAVCRFLLCKAAAKGLVRIRGLYRVLGTVEERITTDVPMCSECAGQVELATRWERPLYMTPGEAVYVGPLELYLRKPK